MAGKAFITVKLLEALDLRDGVFGPVTQQYRNGKVVCLGHALR